LSGDKAQLGTTVRAALVADESEAFRLVFRFFLHPPERSSGRNWHFCQCSPGFLPLASACGAYPETNSPLEEWPMDLKDARVKVTTVAPFCGNGATQPINVQLMVFGNSVRPNTLPSSPWSPHWQVAFLYPKKEK
jgi:hypothetical protein